MAATATLERVRVKSAAKAPRTRLSGRPKALISEPWYARNPWIWSKAALDQQAQVLQWITTGMKDSPNPDKSATPKLDETALFAAMHTCAYQYAHSHKDSSEREVWLRRWMRVRDHIVEANLGLAYSMVGRFNSASMDPDELTSEAMYGLYRAIERYNPWKGYRFSTYACNCIARACMRSRKRNLRRLELTPMSFDTPWNLTTEMHDEDSELRVERLQHVLTENAAQLNPLEKRILNERFPAKDGAARTFKQIARLVGLSKERVRQIQNIALGKLKTAMQEDPVLR